MEKIKKFFQVDLKEYINRYLITHVLILGLTIELLILCNTMKWDLNTPHYMILNSLIMSIIQIFTIESFTNSTKKKFIFSGIAVAISVVISSINEKIGLSLRIQEIIGTYFGSVFLIGIYKIIKDSKLTFNEYILREFENLLKTGIIYLILQVGINLLILIFFYLLIDNSTIMRNVLKNTQILLNCLYLLPAVILSISKTDKECSKIIKSIIAYIIIPLVIIAYIIIYIYFLKIIIKSEIPQNTIFTLITISFCISYFIWTISYKFDGKFIRKVSKIMPFLFIPLFILQIYSLFVRIIPYGITDKRYFGLMILAFELATIILSFIKQRKYEIYIIFITIGILIISFIVPFTNMRDLTNFSQKRKEIEKKLEGNTILEKDKENEDEINNNIYYDNNTLTDESGQYKYIYYYNKDITSKEGLTIPDGYKKIKEGQCYTKGSETSDEGLEYYWNGIKEAEIRNGVTTFNDCNVDLYNYTKNLIQADIKSGQEGVNAYIKANPILKTANENIDFYLNTGATISYKQNDEDYLNGLKDMPTVKEIIYNGYFLYK